jgi:hypothetical protein
MAGDLMGAADLFNCGSVAASVQRLVFPWTHTPDSAVQNGSRQLAARNRRPPLTCLDAPALLNRLFALFLGK